MAVIVRKLIRAGRRQIAAGAILLVPAFPMFAGRAADVRSQLSTIATALTDGNPAQAIAPFDKSFAKYDRLRNYFQGLTDAFQVGNEVDVTDEQDTDDETKLTVNWTLTVTDLATNYSESRSSELNVRLVRDGKKWKIIEFTPIELFNPQRR